MANPYLSPEASPPPPPTAPKPWGFWLTLLFGLVIGFAWLTLQTVATLFFIFGNGFDGGEMDPGQLEALAMDGDVLGWVTVISGLGALVLVWFFIWIRNIPIASYLALRAVRWWQYPIWIVVTILLAWGHGYLGTFFEREEIPEFMVQAYESTNHMPILWIGIALMAPFFEEIFIRGFLYTGWRQSAVGVVGAALLTTAIWTVIHQQYDWFDLAWIFAFGLILCLAREVTRSLWVPIVMHVFNNAWATYWTGAYIQQQ